MQFYDEDSRAPREKKVSLAPIIIAVVVFIMIIGIMAIREATVFGTIGSVMSDEIKKDKEGCNVEITAVIDHHADKDGHEGNGTVYAPVYRFEYEGETYKVTGKVWMPDPIYEDGQEVQIMIDPSDPNHIYDPDNNIGTGMSSFFTSLIPFLAPVLILPLLIIIVPAVFVIKNVKRDFSDRRFTRE